MAAISVMLRLGESSMNSGALLTSAAVCTSLRLSSRPSWPLRRRWPLTWAREQSKRSPSSSADISRLTNSTGLSRSILGDRTCSAMFMARAVLPMLGRAARITSSESCRPPVISSKSMKPVSRPPNACCRCMRASMRASDSCSTSRTERTCVSPLVSRMPNTRCFGAGQHLAGFDGRLVGFLDDVGAGVDQRAEDRLVADDAGVVLGVGGGGDFLAQLQQERGAADGF